MCRFKCWAVRIWRCADYEMESNWNFQAEIFSAGRSIIDEAVSPFPGSFKRQQVLWPISDNQKPWKVSLFMCRTSGICSQYLWKRFGDKGLSLRSLKSYFVLPVFYLYHGINCVWPASWLKVFFTIQVKFSLSFTKLLIQSVCEHALTTVWRCGHG